MKGELKISVTKENMNNIVEQLKNSSRFSIKVVGTAVSINKIHMSLETKTTISLHDPQIVYLGNPIDSVNQIRIDKLRAAKSHEIEIRLTNSGRRSLISFIQRYLKTADPSK